MNSEFVDPKLYEALYNLSKDDLILQQVLKKNSSSQEFINALICAIICILEREKNTQETIAKLLNSNPEIEQLLKQKYDKTMLSKSSS